MGAGSLGRIGQAVIFCGFAAAILWFSNPIRSFYYDHLANPDDLEMKIAMAWNRTISSGYNPATKFRAIIVGTNGAIDVVVEGSLLLRKLGISEEMERKLKPKERDFINNLDHLAQAFTHFYAKGAGGERFMNDMNLYKKAVATAKAMPRAELSIGGNAALIAQALIENAPNNVRVAYGGLVGPALKKMFHPRIMVTQSAMVEVDEYHIIMEYKKGEKWAGHVCPIASRFIFSHDMTNGHMLGLERFVESFHETMPDLVVLSGLHMLESQSPTFWKTRLAEIASALSRISNNIPIHLELASMADQEFVRTIAERIFPVINSIGLNEQELWLLCSSISGPHCIVNGRNVDLEGPPSTGVANDIIYWILDKFSTSKYRQSRFDRIHFHTLTHHTVATLHTSRWVSRHASVAAGVRTASLQACGDYSVQPTKVDIHLKTTVCLSAGALPDGVSMIERYRQLDFHNPVLSWNVSDVDFYLSPALVCKSPVKTVGLGDAISSAGLLNSGYRKIVRVPKD